MEKKKETEGGGLHPSQRIFSARASPYALHLEAGEQPVGLRCADSLHAPRLLEVGPQLKVWRCLVELKGRLVRIRLVEIESVVVHLVLKNIEAKAAGFEGPGGGGVGLDRCEKISDAVRENVDRHDEHDGSVACHYRSLKDLPIGYGDAS